MNEKYFGSRLKVVVAFGRPCASPEPPGQTVGRGWSEGEGGEAF